MPLFFCDFIDRSPQALELRVLLGRRPPIRPSKRAELPVLPRQVPLDVRNRRLKPNDVDVRVLRMEFGNPSSRSGKFTQTESVWNARTTCGTGSSPLGPKRRFRSDAVFCKVKRRSIELSREYHLRPALFLIRKFICTKARSL
jgi:hypothetical protein